MKKLTGMILAIFMLLSGGLALGEDLIVKHNTGDKELDRALGALDDALKGGIGDFGKEIGKKYDLPPETVDWMLKKVGMAPSDAYMAAKVAKTADKPIQEVVKEYEANKGKGWGKIARNLGIKPGSPEFHALKSDDSGILEESISKGKGKSKNKGKGKGKGKEKKKK